VLYNRYCCLVVLSSFFQGWDDLPTPYLLHDLQAMYTRFHFYFIHCVLVNSDMPASPSIVEWDNLRIFIDHYPHRSAPLQGP